VGEVKEGKKTTFICGGQKTKRKEAHNNNGRKRRILLLFLRKRKRGVEVALGSGSHEGEEGFGKIKARNTDEEIGEEVKPGEK